MLSKLSSQPDKSYFPAISCAIAAILWGLLWYPLRLLDSMGIHGLWSALVMYAVMSLCIIYPAWKSRYLLASHKLQFIFIALLAGWTNLAFILAMLEGEVVRVLLLFYLSPVWAILLAIFVLRERLTAISMASICLAMFGAVLMLWQPGFNFFRNFNLADFYAITAGMSFAMMNVMLRLLDKLSISLKMSATCIGVIVLCIAGLLFLQLPVPQISSNAGVLLFLAGFPFLFVMTWTAQYGVTHIPIQRSSIIFLLEIVVGALSAAILTDEIVSKQEYIGGVLIISGGLISILMKNESN